MPPHPIRSSMILFTADLHIKIGAKNIPKDWARNRYDLFLEQVNQVESKCDLHIVGGDVFDRVPNLEELEVYFKFVKQCITPTLVFSGNHEATKKNNSFFPQLKEVTKALNPLVDVVTEVKEYDKFTILPYEFLHMPNSIENCNPNKALFTHVRGEIPPHVKPEVDLDRFNAFPIVYAGDLHSHTNCQRNIVYPGSPMTTSFHRSLVDTGYILIDSKDLTSWTWHKFDLPQLIRRTVSDPAEMLETTFHRTIYELEGDMKELSSAQISNKDILDKKIVKRKSTSQLDLVDKTVQEEMVLYMTKILELPKNTQEEVLEEFNAMYEKA